MNARLLFVLVVALVASPAVAAIPMVPTGQWTAFTPGGIHLAPGVGDENWTTWVYSSSTHGVLVYGKYHGIGQVTGGEDQNALLAYNLDSNAWSLFAPGEQCGSADLPGDGHDEGNVIFDSVHQVYLAKGNLTLGCSAEGTYEYDVCSRAGSQILPTDGPAHSESNSGSFDVDDDAWVMYGGGPGISDETFVYHHATATWTHSHPNPSPPARAAAAQFYDRKHKRTVLFGGTVSESGPAFNDTWTYDVPTDTWTQLTFAGDLPPPSVFSSLAYDDVNQVALLVAATSYTLDLDSGWARRPDADLGGLAAQISATSRLAYEVDDQIFLYLPGTYLAVYAFRTSDYVAGFGTPGGVPCGTPIPPEPGVDDGGIGIGDDGGIGDGGRIGGGDGATQPMNGKGCSCALGGPSRSSNGGFLIVLVALLFVAFLRTTDRSAR